MVGWTDREVYADAEGRLNDVRTQIYFGETTESVICRTAETKY